MPLVNPPTLDDLPATPDRADRTSFAVRCTALFDHLKNTSVPQWRSAFSWMNAAVALTAQNLQDAAAQALLSGQRADAAAGAAANAAQTLAAAQAALGARKWAPGPYDDGACAWSPSNGRLYRARQALAASGVDPVADRAHWFDLSQVGLPIGYVDDTGGNLYGEPNGGLNMINVMQFAGGPCAKYLPQQPSDGDTCVIVVANARTDNSLLINPVQPIALVVGRVVLRKAGDCVVLDRIARPITFQFFAARNEWRAL